MTLRPFACALLALSALTAAPAAAQNLDRWSAKPSEAKVCTEPTGGSCVTLTCAPGGKLNLRINGSRLQPGRGSLQVDGRPIGSGTFSGSQGFASVLLDPRQNASILAAMQKGNRLRAVLPGKTVDVSLSGSSAAISGLIRTCTTGPAPVPPQQTRTAGARRADELTVSVEDNDLPLQGFTTYRNMDIWGGDMRSGLTDPLLKGINQQACARLCIATEGCGAFTHNQKDGEVCFLKTRGARLAPYDGATSGILNIANETHLLPPTPGPLPVVDPSVAWRPDDSVLSHALRTRSAAAPLAESCAAERAELSRLASDLRMTIPEAAPVAGEPVELAWSGNTLAARIPVWIVASTPDPARTSGLGTMTLGPAAPNPFGITHAGTETRALVSLWSRGAPEAGSISLRPLQSGPFRVRMALVAYLRACAEEVTLTETSATLAVAPAAAELVVGTDLSRADLTHFHDIPALDRRITAGTTRFRITALSDGTEIIERAGAEARLSPTGRFLTVRHDALLEVIDIVDGATVTTIDSRDDGFVWGTGDSVVLGTTAPWANVDYAFPFAERYMFKHQLTGPSCCTASPEETHAALDLANGTATLRGRQGHALGPAQGSTFIRETAGNAYVSSDAPSAAMQAITLRSIGPVAPVALANGYSFPGGHSGLRPPITETGQPVARDSATEPVQVASLFRSAGGGDSGEQGTFERIGLNLAQGITGRPLVTPYDRGTGYGDASADHGAAKIAELEATLNSLGAPVGWKFDLLERPPGQYSASNCFDYLGSTRNIVDGQAMPEEDDATRQEVYARPGHLALPETIDQIDLIETPQGNMLVGRISCVAGATGGTLRGSSGVFVLELQPGQQPLSIQTELVNAFGYMGADTTPQFQNAPLAARLYDRRLVLHTPGNGGIAVYDLDGATDPAAFTRLLTSLPSGDLLSDAYLTETGTHVLQMNRDGSFNLWAIATGALTLSGRIVDDEIAVWSPDYRFDATAEAASLIDLRFPGLNGQFSLDRFGAQLYVSGLAAALAAGETLPAVPIAVPPDLTGEIRAEGDQISASVQIPRNRAAAELQVFQDGVLTNRFGLSPNGTKYDFTVPRLPGTRHAALVALSDKRLASQALTQDLGSTHPGGTNRALAVAVDLYSDDALDDLNYAKADADRLMRTLSALPASAPRFEPPEFVGGRRAAPADVLAALDRQLDGLGPDGHLTLFFAGHGLQGTDGDFYLAMYGTDLDDLPGTALRFDDIASRLQATRARVTILIDACHSGDAGNGLFATNDGALSGLAGLPENVTILAASKGRQFSIEAAALEGGLFTVALERVLNTERALHDTNQNGRIEASELSRGLRHIVSGQSEGRQVPWMTKGRIVGDYALF